MKSRPSVFDLLPAAGRIRNAIRERLRDRRVRRLLRKTPVRSLADLGEHELARFIGRVRPFERRLLEAPLSGRLCVYYDVSVEALVGGNFAGNITSEQEAIAFVVEADGARAAIDPTHAQISAAYDHVRDHDLAKGWTMSERERAFLDRPSFFHHRQLMVSGVRLREAILEAEERITVVGAGVREPDPHTAPDGYRDERRTWLRMMGTARFPLIISDDPRSI